MASYGFTSLNKNLNNNLNNGFNVQTALATSGLITTGRVVSIVLDDSHPLWEEVGEYNGIGTIEFQSVTDP